MKYLYGVLAVGAVLGSLAFFNLTPFRTIVQQVVGSAVGTTFNTAKIASVNMTPSSGSASSTSLLNGDASARWVKNVDVGCTGVGTSNAFVGQAGVANWHLLVATTSVANNGLQGNTTYVGNVLIATSTSFSQSASSTVASAISISTDQYYWPAGSYLTFDFDATNTAACTVSASYIAS